jgi:hypothetical protein
MNTIVMVAHILEQHEDYGGRVFFLFLGMLIGYISGCIRRTMIYTKKMKVELHEVHLELDRIETEVVPRVCRHPLQREGDSP